MNSAGGIYVGQKGKFTFIDLYFEDLKNAPFYFVDEESPNLNYEIEFTRCSFVQFTSNINSLIVLPENFGQSLSFNSCTFLDSFSNSYVIKTNVFASIMIDRVSISFTQTSKCEGINIIPLDSNVEVEITIDSCIFQNNQVGTVGAAISIQLFKYLIIQNCTFSQCIVSTTTLNGGAIYHTNNIPTTSLVVPKAQIIDCKFNNNRANTGHRIYIDSSESFIEINDCILTDNHNSNYVIVANDVKESHFNNNVINFSANTNACGGIKINCVASHFISDSKFVKSSSQGAIDHEITSTINANNYQISVENCLFDQFTGSNSPAFKLWCTQPIIFHNNTVQNRKGHYIGWISHRSSSTVRTLSITSCKFINLTNALNNNHVTNCGGCGLWIVIDKTTKYSITFDDCYFENNHAPNGNGGANDYGFNTDTLKSNKVTFLNCRFIKNNATSNGGAISISTIYQSTIKNCTFTENVASSNGGAIYIYPNYVDHIIEACTISSCIFNENSANTNGHAIYLDTRESDTSFHLVEYCTFENNY